MADLKQLALDADASDSSVHITDEMDSLADYCANNPQVILSLCERIELMAKQVLEYDGEISALIKCKDEEDASGMDKSMERLFILVQGESLSKAQEEGDEVSRR